MHACLLRLGTRTPEMTTPASAIKRQVDDLIQLQIIALKESSSLSPSDLAEYHDRHSTISRLVKELD
jgi:hypothetical protein